jgi:hypothetical protein
MYESQGIEQVVEPINPYRAPDAGDPMRVTSTDKKENQTLRALVVLPLLVIGIATTPVGIGLAILIATHVIDRWLLKGPSFFGIR